MSLDMSRYLELFVQEATEHVENMAKELLELEKGHSEELVDSLFRHAHSVKGMAASMGFAPITRLAHSLEDLMEVVRSKKLELPSDAVDVLLRATDALGELVGVAADTGKVPDDEHDTAQIEDALAVIRGRLVETKPSTTRRRKPELASKEPAKAKEIPPASPADPREIGVAPNLRVLIQVEGSSKVPGVRGFLVHKRLSSVGQVVRSFPSLAELKSGQMPGNRLEVLLATTAGPDVVERALGTIAELSSIRVEEAGPEDLMASPAPSASAVAVKSDTRRVRTVRVRTDLLDGFMDNVGELLLASERIRELAPKGENEGEGPTELEEAIDRLARIVNGLHANVLATRMTPLATVTDRLPRVVREISRRLHKEISLTVEGVEIELDRAILDEIDSPITHLIRNSIDHGIEDSQARVAAEKPAAGRLRLSAARDRDWVRISLSDDGRGFDRELLKRTAIERGLLTAEAAQRLADDEVLMLACLPGLSTRENVSDLSGRGVGLDVVRSTVEGLGGTLEITSEEGKGTTFVLRLPLTVAIQKLLLVTVGSEVYGLPVNKVVHVTEIGPAERSRSRGRDMIPFLDTVVPAYQLAHSLGLETELQETMPHVVVEGEARQITAFAVDRLIGQFDAMIKPVGPPLDRLGGLSGVALLPDGRPIFVLDLASLARDTEHMGA